MSANPLAVLRDNPTLEGLERSELVEQLDIARSMHNAWLKHQILVNDRIDLLATEILGYELQPFHLAMLQWQFLHPDNLQMAFRGAGKTTACTVTKSIHLLLKNPNLRIVIASKTITNSQGFLREIKNHFENNALLAEIFGTYFDPRKVTKWDETEITVVPRTSTARESSITCVGVNGTIVGKHYDVEFSDDLVDEENSRTEHMRDKTWTWYYNTLDPCIEPPDAKIPHRGERHRLGTRYHYDDQYGRWMGDKEKPGPLAAHTQIIPALDEKGRSPWPEKYPPEWFVNKRNISGEIIFSAQYLCNTEAMKGEIFQYDDCQVIQDSEIPDNLRTFIGVDLAISEDESADHFALVVLGMDMSDRYYVLDFYDGQKRFHDQTKIIREFAAKYDPIRIVIEENAYQKSQIQNLLSQDGTLNVKGLKTELDKVVRAWKLTPLFENKRVFFRRGMEMVIQQLVLFPAFRYKDLFDAFDMAVSASKIKRKRKNRASEMGLI